MRVEKTGLPSDRRDFVSKSQPTDRNTNAHTEEDHTAVAVRVCVYPCIIFMYARASPVHFGLYLTTRFSESKAKRSQQDGHDSRSHTLNTH